MSKLSHREIEQIARIVAAATDKEYAQRTSRRWVRAGAFFLKNWPLTVLLLGALGFLGAIIYEGASPLYYFKKIAAEDRKATAELNMHGYREGLAQRHLELGYMFLDQGLQDDALIEFQAAKEISEHSVPAALAIRTAELFKQDASGEYNPAVFKTRVVSLFSEEKNRAKLNQKVTGGPASDYYPPPERTITDPHVLAILGNFYRWSGDTEAARKAYRDALSARPTLAHAELGLGHIAYDAGDYQGAIAHYRRARGLYPDNPEYLSNLASALRLAAEHDEAVALFIKARELDPDRLDLVAELCLTLRAQVRFKESYTVLRQIREPLGRKDVMDRLFAAGGKNASGWLFVIGGTPYTLRERDEKIAFLDVSAGLSAALVGRQDEAHALVERWIAQPLYRQRVHSLIQAEIAFLQRQFPETTANLDDFRILITDATPPH